MKRIRDKQGEVSKRRADWKDAMRNRRTNDNVIMMMSTQKDMPATYQAKALAADDFALQVILLDPWSGSSEGEDRCDCHFGCSSSFD